MAEWLAVAKRRLFPQRLPRIHFPLLLPSILLLPDWPRASVPFSLGQHFLSRGGVSRPLYVSGNGEAEAYGIPTRALKQNVPWCSVKQNGGLPFALLLALQEGKHSDASKA
jgi:hypothetical protein